MSSNALFGCFLLLGGFYLASSALTITAQVSLWQESMNDGKKFAAQGRFSEAERSYLVALEEARTFGERDLRLLTSLNELAAVYQGQSKYGEAEALYRRVLGILQAARGKEDSDVATTLNNLAALAYDQGQYARAEPLFRRPSLSEKKFMGQTTQTSPKASTIWPCFTALSANTQNRNPCSSGQSRFLKTLGGRS